MKDLTLRWRIIASFAVVLAVTAVMAGVACSRLADIDRQANFIAKDAIPGLTSVHSGQAIDALNRVAVGLRGVVSRVTQKAA